MRHSLKLAAAILMITASGCAGVGKSGAFDADSVLHVPPVAKIADAELVVPAAKSPTLRIKRYSDLRVQNNPRLIGTSNQLIRGVSGSQLVIDRDLADLVTARLKQRFEQAGFNVLADDDPAMADFEVTGVIKDLTLNVKYRDEIDIAIDTTVVEKQSGLVAWSGLVSEKNDRFAGVSGNTKQDVADYLVERLIVALKKIVMSVDTALTAAHPELFNLSSRVAVPGVTYHIPTEAAGSGDAPTQTGDVALHQSRSEIGVLTVNSNPPRGRIYINDVYYGLTPSRLEMTPGIYPVEIKLDGYRTVTEKVSVRTGDNTEMDLTLQR